MELDQDVEAEQQQLVSSSSSPEASPEVVTGSSPVIADAECKSPSPVHGGIKCEYSAVGGGVERACESVGGGAKHDSCVSVGGAMRHSPAVGVGGAMRHSPAVDVSRESACQSVGGGAMRHSPAVSVGGAMRHSPAVDGSRESACQSVGGGAMRHSPAVGVGGAMRCDSSDYVDKKSAGKSTSRSLAKIKLPTQVALDSEGAVRTDFPFDKLNCRHELMSLNQHTLFPTVLPKKRKSAEWFTDQASESLTTSGGETSDVSFIFGQTKYGSYSCVETTEELVQENSSMHVNVSSNNGDETTIVGGADEMTNVDIVGDGAQTDGDGIMPVGDVSNNNNNVSESTLGSVQTDGDGAVGDVSNNNNNVSESTLGSDELFSSTSIATIPETSLDEKDESPVEPHNEDGHDESPVEPEEQDETLNDDGEDTITEGNKKNALGDQAALMVGGDGEKHVTILVHSDVTGLVTRISKKWKEYSQSMKNVTLNTSPVVSMPYLNSTEPQPQPDSDKTYKMTSSVTSKDSSPKKIKIYVDEDLSLESSLIQAWMQESKDDPTKGPEIGKFLFVFCV